jgi:tetratricopeptide (TPR) repeat protein
MSLLLEALKKAELAKQRAAADLVPDPAAAPEHSPPVMTREKLPDIGQHVEIHTDDLPSAKASPGETRDGARPQALELEIAQDPAPRPKAEAHRGERSTEGQEAARRLFEVKEIDYNPRRPFYLTLAALGLVAVAYGVYVWWQLQPKFTYTTPAVRETRDAGAPSQRPAAPLPVASPALPAPAPAAPVAPAPAPYSAAAAVPSSPRAAPSPRPATPAPARRLAPAPRAASDPAAVTPAALPLPSDPSAPARQSSIAITPPSMQIDPQIERAYEAFQKNDLDTAREIYQGVLQREPRNHDALLGMAAVDVRTGNYETAEARYLRLLELDPRDGYAQAGLLALRQADPVASESRLKNLLVTQPDSPQLLFALGNQYAVQSRWSEAQQAFFRALAADPDNPDYAFNLAVSLDHLHQKPQALEFYRRSLVLADKRPATFDRALAAARARDLQQR